MANPATAGIRVREAFQLPLGLALDRPSRRRHRQVARDASETIYCISFFAAVVWLCAEGDAQLLDGCVSDIYVNRLQDRVDRKQFNKPKFEPRAATDFLIRIKTGRRPPAVFRLNVHFDALR